MIYRHALKYLQQWKRRDNHKPLILRGARQVGKTTLVEMFANSFDQYIHLNLERDADRRLFEQYRDVNKLIEVILFNNRQVLNESQDTLLFIDEIQNSPEAVAMLRYFYEDYPDLYVIAAGSLLENVIDRKISFPVGRVEYMAVHPCSFLEFLNGIGEDFDREAVEDQKGDFIHDRLMDHFRRYCLVGGMPEVVASYAKTRNLHGLDTIYDALIASYCDDVEKYASGDAQAKVLRHIINKGWEKGGEIITFEGFGGERYKSREVSEAFYTIQKAMLLELVYPCTSPRLPFNTQYTRRPKLIWLDTGLVNYKAGMRDEVFNSTDISDAHRGRIAEHVVAQELWAQNPRVTDHRQFWVGATRNSTAEIDFVVPYHSTALPIEVKSGTNSHLRSLHLFMEDAPHDLAVRVWSHPLQVDDVKTIGSGKVFRIVSIPYYYIGILDNILEKL